MPWSITFTITWVIAERSRFEPLDPTTSRTRPSRSSTVGACMLVRRTPGRRWRPAARSSSPIMLFRCSPAPGTITPEWLPLDAVKAAAFPSPSTTEMWVVPRSDATAATAVGAAARAA